MTKIDIFSGFLGAGKTTLIKKLLSEAYAGQKVVLIENEFGEIGIDGGFLQDAGITVNEMNSGCICCSLVGDFSKALAQVVAEYAPDRILIEPSGVGKLSDVIRAVQTVLSDDVVLNSYTTVADANKCKMYMKNFGEFYNDQVESAGAIVLSHTQTCSEKKIADTVALLREKNAEAVIVTTPWDDLSGAQILSAMEQTSTLAAELHALTEEETCPVCGGHHHHHHHDHDHDEECECGHHHDHEHHHDHDEECECGHHHDHEHHHHDHDEECSCGCGGHHHHHHADEVFQSWGIETTAKFTAEGLRTILAALEDEKTCGIVLRAKGIVAAEDGSWLHFDYIPGEPDVRSGSAGLIGRICVIGSGLNEAVIDHLFNS
ncbi:MAG: GTP-binding protein [Clostridia bacterium]|nr:GTP-binding protein [Clostridia bacterium]